MKKIVQNRRKINQTLLENYEVVIEWPDGNPEGETDGPGAAP